MDNSKEYILMCEKAGEIQGRKLFYNRGDFVVNPYCSEKRLVTIVVSQTESLRSIWLPRQDQLQPMVYNHGYNNYFYHHRHFTKFMNTDRNFAKFLTYEQLWLAFVMKEKYNKTWDGKEWTLKTA